ncbi:FtsK/SpoIIIE domain-containing protein [Diaminobutyricimonas sp. TR449]|uniref:FtsK/SpoIIIE domain-containing protein n=1 Tax=Diaminobutyricimonas sp. TR449 TaxID=2708076 RepID=UPI00141E526D|nr:FtsK/SpoIIIE domain-containing protein [Diaminobutyricimonas sp. TR449]
MRLKVTLARDTGSSDDIVITTDAAASIGEIARTLTRVDPEASDRPADRRIDDRALTLQATLPGHTESLLLPPDAPVGEAWIGSGATVRLADAGVFYSPASTGRGPTLATLRVLSGPDAGREFPLTAGTSVLGREAGCDIVLSDRMISKRHVRFEVSNVVEMVDLGSANGVVVDGGLVGRLRIEKSERLLIGDSEVVITIVGHVADAATPTAGPIFFNRSPRVEARYPGQQYTGPEVPQEIDTPPFPFLAMIAPMIMGAALFYFTRSPLSIIFVAMSPLLMIGNYVTQILARKKKQKDAIAKFDARLAALDETLTREKVDERERRLLEAPSTAEVDQESRRLGTALWTRRPEHWSFLNVRLGTGTMPSRNSIKGDSKPEALPDFQERFDALVEKNLTVDGVPLLDNLHDSGALGIAGAPATAAQSANSLLVQLSGLHSPAELAVAAIVSPEWSAPLEWLKWLPHTSSPHSPLGDGSHLADSASSCAALVSALEELISTRLDRARNARRRGAMGDGDAAVERGAEVGQAEGANNGSPAPVPALVLLISDDAPVDRARLVQLAESAADAGVYPIWVAADVPSLPAVCRTWLELGDVPQAARVGYVRLGQVCEPIETEYMTSEAALDFARRMAPVIDAGALVADASDLPRSVSMITLLGHELAEQSEAVIDRWRQNESLHDRTPGAVPRTRRAGRLRAIVGSSGVDAMHLDLRSQGPHALVGGTTGSGKSEFLQAWVLGMAAEYSPDRVTFLFVDYKGGSAFADCVTLPHTVGLVTDLSPHLVQRALTSLRAELHHREHLLNRKKAKDLLELEKRGDPESPPALVLVIDEFAALVGEVPEFVDGVVDIAQRGRSLGIHLIMATQRPAGVIKDNLRANTNLRIALRVADESDSMDVVGVKDAGHFDPGLPGRAIAKTGPGRLTLFQSGYAGGWTSRTPDRPGIEVAQLRFGSEHKWEEPGKSDVVEQRDLGPTDQQRLVRSIAQAAAAASVPPPRRPWLDELAVVYDLGKLRQRTDTALLLGVADLPHRQQQEPVYFQPDVDGNIAIFGTGASGKSTALRTLAVAAGITPRGGPVDVYGLDFGGGGLRMLEQLPHVGAVINGDDSERVIRLFRQLKQELESRAARYAQANAATITDYRALAGKPNEKRILLVLDGYPSFRQEFEIPSGRSGWYGVFQDIVSGGRQLGIHVAFSADRPGSVPSAISSGVQRRIVLRLADETGYGMLDVPAGILGSKSPAGRAVIDGYETQIAVFGGSSVVADQSAALAGLATAMRGAGRTDAPAVRSLPREFPPSMLPDHSDGLPVLGLSEDDLGPLPFDPVGTLLVAGPPASGRSTALAGLVSSLNRFDPDARLYYIGNRRSKLAGDARFTAHATSIDEAAALARSLVDAVADEDTEGRIAIVVEQLADFLTSAADQPLVDLIKAVKRSEHLLIAEGETSTWSSSWPLLGEIKNSRRGLLLQPETIEGDLLLKTQLPRVQRADFPEGRGMWIAGGKSVRVQLPLA